MKIVYFGTPDFAAKILSALVAAGIEIVAIVTKPDSARGRSLKQGAPEVKSEAEKLKLSIPILQPVKCSTDEMEATLAAFGADLFVVAAFGEIISQKILDIAPLGCINVHASLLPKFRGAAPMQHAIMQGETESGITIIKMVKKMDAGDILAMQAVPITDEMTVGELEKALSICGGTTLIEAIKAIEDKSVTYMPQDETLVTFAPKITSNDCLIDWHKPVQVIHNQIRALSPHPGAFCYVYIRGEKKRLKIVQAKVRSSTQNYPVNAILESKNAFEISCEGGILTLISVQLEGKPVLSASEFIKGTPVSQITLA